MAITLWDSNLVGNFYSNIAINALGQVNLLFFKEGLPFGIISKGLVIMEI